MPMIDRGPACGASAESPADDLIVSWLSMSPAAPGASSVGPDTACPSCGYVGEMESEADRPVCPACLAELPAAQGDSRLIPCPGCGASIELRAEDAGRTIICRACKYFLGCVRRDERPRPWRRRWRGGA